MKIRRILYVVAALAVLALAGCAQFEAPPPGSVQELLKKANEVAIQAQNTKGDKLQIEAFLEAIKQYGYVLKKKNGETPEAAEAQLAIAKIMAGLPIDAKPGPTYKPVFNDRKIGKIALIVPTETTWQKEQEYAARDQFRTIVQKYHGKTTFKQLTEDYGIDGARRIQSVIDQSKIYQDQLALDIDVRNRGSWLYKSMDGLVAITGRVPAFSYWFAIVLITLIVKIIITPLTKAQFKSMKEMQRLQPLIKELQEKYKGDQREIGAKTMQLYKEHGVNPLSGCLPILIQMPILILVYTMIRYYEFQFSKGTFLWIGWPPVVEKFAVPLMNRPVWLTAPNLAQPDLILLVLYTISMVVSQRISIVDATQAEQQKMMSIMMPVMFFFFIGYLPSAFVLYWLLFNILQTWQQYHVIHAGGAGPDTGPSPAPVEPSGGAPRRPARARRRRKR